MIIEQPANSLMVQLSSGSSIIIWLVVYLPLWKIWYSQLGLFLPIYGKIKHVPNHQPEITAVDHHMSSLLENFQGQVHMSQLQRRLLRFKDLLGPRKPLQRHQMRLAGKVCRGLADPHGDMAYTAPVPWTVSTGPTELRPFMRKWKMNVSEPWGFIIAGKNTET